MLLVSSLVPVFCGSAFKNKGVQLLLDAVLAYLPTPDEKKEHALDLNNNEEKIELVATNDKPLCALAFKLQETQFGQLTYMRVYQGKIGKGDFIVNNTNKKSVKVPRLMRMHSDEVETDLYAGDIVAVFDHASGDTFCLVEGYRRLIRMDERRIAVISLAVAPKDKAGANNFGKALQKFRKEDPTFHVHRDESPMKPSFLEWANCIWKFT